MTSRCTGSHQRLLAGRFTALAARTPAIDHGRSLRRDRRDDRDDRTSAPTRSAGLTIAPSARSAPKRHCDELSSAALPLKRRGRRDDSRYDRTTRRAADRSRVRAEICRWRDSSPSRPYYCPDRPWPHATKRGPLARDPAPTIRHCDEFHWAARHLAESWAPDDGALLKIISITV